MQLAEIFSPDLREMNIGGKIVMLPLGSFEQHGPHLPLTTDTDIVTAVAQCAEQMRPEKVLRLPTLWIGHSTHHLGFPGTLSLRQLNYVQIILDLCESIVTMGGKKTFLLNGHGGNDIPVRAALRELKTQEADRKDLHFVYASYWMLAGRSIQQHRQSEIGGMGHACELETSIMLHLFPEKVRMDRAARGGPRTSSPYRKGDLLHGKPVYYVSEFHELSETGVVGHPDLASAAKGEKFLDGIVHDVVAFIDDFLTW